MALFQVQLKEDTERAYRFIVCLLWQTMALISLFLRCRCLTCSFSRGYWITEVATAGWTISILGCHFGSDTGLCVQNKKGEKMPVMHSFIHISLILFFLCILWLLWCALSCQRVQADLFSWCMHNLVVMKPAWRRGPLKHKRHMCVCIKSQLGAADVPLYWLWWDHKAKETSCGLWYRHGCSGELAFTLIISHCEQRV